MSLDVLLLFFLLAVVVPLRGYLRYRELARLRDTESLRRLPTYLLTILFQWLLFLLVVVVSRRHQIPLSALGLRLSSPSAGLLLAWTVGLASVLVAAQLIGLWRAARQWARSEVPSETRQLLLTLLPRTRAERLAFVALALTAGFCEEFIYRGFVFFQLRGVLDPASALLFAAVLFALAHIYQGVQGALKAGALGALFTLPLIATGSLVPGMIAHFAVDAAAGLAAPRFLKAGDKQEEAPVGRG